jgi:hypothetical protein
VARFEEHDLVKLVDPNGSAELGCVLGAEPDGFVFGLAEDKGQLIPYRDVASVDHNYPGKLRKVLDAVGRAAYIGGVWLGVWRIGGDTLATDVARVIGASGLTVISIPHPVLRCS